ncbi:MAG: alginate lyase family protein, partial [Opitutaceae bacterium]|nr:alginate lyase family protein [Opitutaceae bacterium]
MVESANLWRLTRDPRYAEWTCAQLDFYADNYPRWPLRKNGTARLGCQSLEDATWLAPLVDSARLVFDYAGETRRQAWFDKLLEPQAELLGKSHHYIHNISTWHRASAAQVALLYKDEALWTRAVDGPYGVREQIRRGVTSDYIWYEQAMGYNGYITVAMRPLLTLAGLTGKGERLRDEAAIVQNLLLAPAALRFPDGTIPNPADA